MSWTGADQVLGVAKGTRRCMGSLIRGARARGTVAEQASPLWPSSRLACTLLIGRGVCGNTPSAPCPGSMRYWALGVWASLPDSFTQFSICFRVWGSPMAIREVAGLLAVCVTAT